MLTRAGACEVTLIIFATACSAGGSANPSDAGRFADGSHDAGCDRDAGGHKDARLDAIKDGSLDRTESVRSEGGPDAEDDHVDAGPPRDASPDCFDGGPTRDASPDRVDGGPTLNILFIGDSYTFVNDLPGMLSRIAATAGAPPTITTSEVVYGGATLEYQWEAGAAQPLIQSRQFTHVVLQDQSVEPAIDRLNFTTYADQFGDLILDAGSTPVLFVTWARAAGDTTVYPNYFDTPAEMQDQLTIAYASVAKTWPNSLMSCVGPAFQRSLQEHPDIVLQQSDHSHPTVAGTYLAACTFYVALTGNPVPDQSEVPAGVSAQQATALRQVAQIGQDCRDVVLRGIVDLSDMFGIFDLPGEMPFDYGTAGTAITSTFYVYNSGGMTASLADGLTLAPPFSWTGGSYPGGSGIISGVPFCSDTVDAGSQCALSVTYDGTATASGEVSVAVTGTYLPTASRQVKGTSTDRALLMVNNATVPFDLVCQDEPCTWMYEVQTDAGTTLPFNLVLMNRGGAPTTEIEGSPLAAPFSWRGGSDAFPGGDGRGSVDGGGSTYPYCTTTQLEPGDYCLMSLAFSPPDAGGYAATLTLTYSDPQGPIAPDVTFDLAGHTPSTGPTPIGL
jgi:hypothetical protein